MASGGARCWRREEAAPPEDLAQAALTLARHFAAGATMWCVSPPWPSHGRHLAVEFVHPVIVGKRALPAVHLEGPDVGRRPATPGPGRATCCWRVSTADDPVTVDLLRRPRHGG